MEKWVHDSLSGLLDFPVPTDLTQYILQIRNGRDLDEYFKTLLDYDNPKHRQFIAELKKRQATSNNLVGYKKSADNDNANQKQNEKKKGKLKGKDNQVEVIKPEKKKTKFVNLYSQEGKDRETILLKGRHGCNCEAKKHSLVNNCLNCGRIVCVQEGAGPCFFCNELVCSPDQLAVLSSNSKQADNLYNKLMDQKPRISQDESVKLRDKLLEYDRNSARRTKVIDDESDYYQTNSVWLTQTEREQLQKREDTITAKKHGSRLDRKIIFDFAGREVTDDDEHIDELNDPEFNESTSTNAVMNTNLCPFIEFKRPTYKELNVYKSKASNALVTSDTKRRIQDKEYLEMVDEGLCLSMHQPYASLLVEGIKIHEGRTWYSSHRGRLWIASTAKVFKPEEISAVENQYRVLKDEKIMFPENYPNGCLLGCVTVVDVLPQTEYRNIYPDGESDSPYVFICKDNYKLPIKFPIQGKHKIYKLDSKIHQAAVTSLQRIAKEKVREY